MNGELSPGASPYRELHVFVTFIRDATDKSGGRMTEVADRIAKTSAKLECFVIRAVNTQNTVRIYVKPDLSMEQLWQFERKLWLIAHRSPGARSSEVSAYAGWLLWHDVEDGTTVYEKLTKPTVW